MAWLYKPSRRFGQMMWSVTGRLTVTGQEAMPPYGPLLVASNHLSLNDAGTLVVALPRQVVFLAKKELWEKPIGRFYCNAVGAVPLDRQRGGGGALRFPSGIEDHARVDEIRLAAIRDLSLRAVVADCRFGGPGGASGEDRSVCCR